MAKNYKKRISAILATLMCVSTMNTAAFAEQPSAADTTWLGGDAQLCIEAGKEPYVYAIAQDPANNRWYYETSNHTVKKEVTGGGAVHIFPMVDTTKVTGEWTPDGIYESGVSNYDVMYCCDAVTGTADGIYYKRVNLEDSEYVSDADAKKLREIVSNAYPYVTVEEARAYLEDAGFAQADELDRSELIAATQAAIWTIANPDSGDSYRYNKTATTAQKLTWGGYMHEFAPEITHFTDSTTNRKYLSNPNGVGDRVNALIDFYLAMDGVEAESNQIVITNLDVSATEMMEKGFFEVDVTVQLNGSGSSTDDNIALNIYVDNEVVSTQPIVHGTVVYKETLKVNADQTVKAVVSGTQVLPRGVYFYVPEPQDINGDGIATSREVSQNLIGVSKGETPVYAEASIGFNKVTFNSGEVSNISYMFLNEETGEVEFIKKIDIEDDATCVPILLKDGYVSVMFMKQATSGMFWFSEEVGEDLQNAAIECLKANNPSYKGHNAIAFGEGNHELEFKKNKFVTYSFDTSGASVELPEEVVEEETVEESDDESSNNGSKNKDKKNNGKKK